MPCTAKKKAFEIARKIGNELIVQVKGKTAAASSGLMQPVKKRPGEYSHRALISLVIARSLTGYLKPPWHPSKREIVEHCRPLTQL